MMELSIFSMISFIVMKIIEYNTSYNNTLMPGIMIVVALLYKSRAVQRLERVLERTEEVRRVKVRERYRELYAS